MVDISKIRIGDHITVNMKVKEVDLPDYETPLRVVDGMGTVDFWVHSSDIITHEPAPRQIANGDLVRSLILNKNGIVKAIDGQHAWVQLSGENYYTLPLNTLELC